jgi:hypothetical protein
LNIGLQKLILLPVVQLRHESFSKEMHQAYPGYQIVYVYITNANIKKDAEEAIAKYRTKLIVVDGSIASQYFAPIILPYFTFVDLVDKTSSTQDE